ncbi:hypothetical protein LCGC14_2317850, partial [marine sediment metagenome]
YKYYHTDDSKFYSATDSVDYADELFAVTFHTTTTSQTIIRFIKTADGTWWKKEMLDANTDAVILIDGGSAIGTFERLNDKVYFSNYENDVLQLRPRRSAGDTDADYIYKAGLPDPNAIRVIDRAEETAGWTLNVGGGAGDSEIDRSPLHRLQGKASLMFSQETDGQTSTLNFNSSTVIDCSTFEDGTNSDDSDFIAFELFRFNKRAISEIVFYISSGEFTNNFFSIPITVTSDLTNEDGTTWDSYHYHQTTTMAEWAMNFHDNQMFRVRLRKSWFEITNTTGAPNWDNIKKMYAQMAPRSLINGVWMINQSCWTELMNMTIPVGTGGIPVWMPANLAQDRPNSTLMGMPVIPVEQCATLGTVGDIVLGDWTQYVAITKGGLQSAQSMHVRFINDEQVFRFVYRVDGQPIWNKSLTPYKDATTSRPISPFLALETRA